MKLNRSFCSECSAFKHISCGMMCFNVVTTSKDCLAKLIFTFLFIVSSSLYMKKIHNSLFYKVLRTTKLYQSIWWGAVTGVHIYMTQKMSQGKIFNRWRMQMIMNVHNYIWSTFSCYVDVALFSHRYVFSGAILDYQAI